MAEDEPEAAAAAPRVVSPLPPPADNDDGDAAGTADAAAAAAANAGEMEVEQAAEQAEAEDEILKGLYVLPPRQRPGSGSGGAGGGGGDEAAAAAASTPPPALALPHIRPEEPVQSIKAALAEVVGLSHITNYRLELDRAAAGGTGEGKDDGEGKARSYGPWKPEVVSPYTGPNAVVAVPTQHKALDENFEPMSRDVLDEWGDLKPLLARGLKSGSAFAMVLQRYDVASVKDHVARLRSLLNGNAPSVTSLVDELDDGGVVEGGSGAGGGGAADAVEQRPSEDSAAGAAGGEAETKNGKEKEGGEGKDAAAAVAAQEQPKQEERPLPPLPDTGMLTSSSSRKHDLKHFYYYSSGEDPNMYHGDSKMMADAPSPSRGGGTPSKSKKKKKNKNSSSITTSNGGIPSSPSSSGDHHDPINHNVEQEMREKMPLWNALDDVCKVECRIDWGGFHPPPHTRRLMGDLAYLEFQMMTGGEGYNEPVIHVTATRTGFYVNRSNTDGKAKRFDPSPASEPCFSHALLDCLLQASKPLCEAWKRALDASLERAEIIHQMNLNSPSLSLFRVAVRADFPGFATPASADAAAQGLDPTLHTPSWLVPAPSEDHYGAGAGADGANASSWTRSQYHPYEPARAEEEFLLHSMGVDLRSGGIRDWNEELQLAREMPISSITERIERARLLHKVMSEFGEASLQGVKAISEGQVTPMNPNETMRTQVYLHNNIFFSRAIDAGPETFKVAKGDRAARKTANRDLQCNGILHRMEKSGVHTLAVVLVDYLGTRFVCQSILPGILIGERAHKLLLGAVESGIPLKWDKEMHELLSEKVGESMMLASRPVYRSPLTEERLQEIERLKKELPVLPEPPRVVSADGKEKEEEEKPGPNDVMTTCVPIEAKAILGSDQRRYMLDIGRFTPRDANWIPGDKGGTGKWEAARKENNSKPSSSSAIPLSLEDDEWTTCVLRPELVTRFTQVSMSKYIRAKREKEALKKKEEEEKEKASKDDKEAEAAAPAEDKPSKADDTKEDKDKQEEKEEAEEEEEEEEEEKLSEADLEHLKSLRFNVNVFLPDVKSFEGINDEAAKQVKEDEQRVRDASEFLWEDVLPKLTRVIKEGSLHQGLPVDGKTVTEFLHRNGVNCRYLGRLAVLAQQQEQKDAKMTEELKHSRFIMVERRTMPKCWLELLEVEMVARAAKHVLDSYFTEHGGAAAAQPAQTVASFLSALVSESEETAAQTETRLEKRGPNDPDEDDYGTLTIADTGGDGDALPSPIRSRYEVWQDIELEVGRRFRYTLTLFNTGNKSGRARHIPLLRRVCQRTGVRLLAKNYDVGGRCLCSGGNTFGGRLTGSYPVSPLDIADIVPLMKHVAAYNEGFYPCSLTPAVTLPPLQVSLQDARVALERSHIQTSSRALQRGLELAQEALQLYQRVTESPAHPGVIESMELMATIFSEGGDFVMAASHGEKALSLSTQTYGFDSAHAVNGHQQLFQMQFVAREMDCAVKHLRAVVYLLETLAGPNHSENFSSLHKLGTVYSQPEYNGRYLSDSLKLFEEAAKRDSADRLMEGILAKSVSKIHAGMGEYKDAIEKEKQANRLLTMFLGKEHQWVKDSDEELKSYTKLAVQKGSRTTESEKMREEAAKADAAAADLVAEEEKAKPKKNKKKKGKK